MFINLKMASDCYKMSVIAAGNWAGGFMQPVLPEANFKDGKRLTGLPFNGCGKYLERSRV